MITKTVIRKWKQEKNGHSKVDGEKGGFSFFAADVESVLGPTRRNYGARPKWPWNRFKLESGEVRPILMYHDVLHCSLLHLQAQSGWQDNQATVVKPWTLEMTPKQLRLRYGSEEQISECRIPWRQIKLLFIFIYLPVKKRWIRNESLLQ